MRPWSAQKVNAFRMVCSWWRRDYGLVDTVADLGPQLRISVLGPLTVEYGGQSIVVTGVARRVLALLARTPGRVVSLSGIVAGLWAQDPPARPENAVGSYISRLRRALSRATPGDNLASVVVTRSPGYLLDIAPSAVDSAVFETLVTQGRRALAAVQPELAARRLREALALWRGDAYAEFADYPFARTESVRLGEVRMSAVQARIEADLAVAAPGASPDLAAELEGLVADHPHREQLWAFLITSLYREGRQADALAAYQRARDHLVGALGVEPGAEIRAVERSVLTNAPALRGTPIQPARLPDLLASAGPVCVGRDEELAWLTGALDAAACEGGQARYVVGVNGIGKTQLVTEFARRAAARGVTCRYGQGALALEALVADPARLSLVLLDDVDEVNAAEAARIAGWLRAGASGPVLTVLTARSVIEEFASLRRLDLTPLNAQSVAELVDLYAPGDSEALAAAKDADGVPVRVHEAATRWVLDRASGRVHHAVSRSMASREQLGEAREEIVTGVLQLEDVHARSRSVRGRPDLAVLCPYKGLARFEFADAELFHGRQRLVAELVARLVGMPLLALVGGSGSGKSSAVRAGLLPTLAAGALPGSAGWRQVVLTPTSGDLASVELGTALFVVDQFEEVFTALDAQRRQAFLADLVQAAEGGRAVVVLTMRSDFYGRCADHPGLAALVSANTVLLGRMSVEETRAAIERPAELAGLRIEDGLTDLLVEQVRDAAGALPLLSTALLSLWQRRSGRTLTTAAYHESGGVAGAVEQLGERAYARFNSDAERDAARRMLLRLASSAGEHTMVRRRAPRAEIESIGGEAGATALSVLADGRLVITDRDWVEVAHEALLAHWPRLREWLAEDAAGRQLRSHLTPAATAWLGAGRVEGELYRGPRLAAALAWAEEHPRSLTPLESDFLTASHDAALADDLRRRRNLRRLRVLLTAAATALIVAVAGGAIAVAQRRRAEVAGMQADARRLGAQALVETDLRRALLLAVAAARLEGSWHTTGNLLAVLNRSPQLLRVAGVGEGARLLGMALSPDGKTLAVSANDSRIQIYDTASMRLLKTFSPNLIAVPRLDFTQDGKILVALGVAVKPDGHGLQAWRSDTWQPTGAPFGPSRFSPGSNPGGGILENGDTVVTINEDNTIGAWSLTGQQPQRTLAGPDDYRAITVAESGRTVVAVSRTGVTLIDGHTGQPSALGEREATSAAVSPDGRTVLIGTSAGDIAIWDRHGRTRQGVVRRHSSLVTDVSWSPDGQKFASTAQDLVTLVWDRGTLTPIETLTGPSARQMKVKFSLSDQTLYTVGQDGGLYFWDLSRRRGIEKELDPPGFYTTGKTPAANRGEATFDFRHDRAVIFEEGQAFVVDLKTGKPIGPPIDLGTKPDEMPTRLYEYPTLSPDGRYLAVGSRSQGHGRVWDIDSRQLILDTGKISPREFNINTAFTGDGRTVAFVGYGHDGGADENSVDQPSVVWLYDIASGRQIGEPIIGGRVGHDRLAFSPDGRYLAMATVEGVAIWDVASRRRVAMLRDTVGEFISLRFSHDGTTLAGGLSDGRPINWQVGTWRTLWKADVGHNGPSGWISFSPDGRILASSGTDSKIYLYDAATGAPIVRALGPNTVESLIAEFRPDRDEIVGYFGDGSLHQWDLDFGAWIDRACAVAGRDMTPEEWLRAVPGRPFRQVCPPTTVM